MLFTGIRRCLRACRDGQLEMVRFRESNDLILVISSERIEGAAIATLSVCNNEELLRAVRMMLVGDFAQEGTVSEENAEDGMVHIYFLVPVQQAE